MAEVPELLDYVESSTDLDVIAITDHDSLAGALAARELWAHGHYRFDLIVGMEVTALEGHIIALYLEDPVPSLRPVDDVLEAVHKQGGICIIPHPMSWLTRSLGQRAIERVIANRRDGVYFDGLETANQSAGARVTLNKAARLNHERYHLAEVGGSDAHFLTAIGSAYTQFTGSTAQELRQAILEKKTLGINGQHPSLLQIGMGKVLRQTWRGLNVTPRQMGWGPTAKSFIKRIFPIIR